MGVGDVLDHAMSGTGRRCTSACAAVRSFTAVVRPVRGRTVAATLHFLVLPEGGGADTGRTGRVVWILPTGRQHGLTAVLPA
ncbi:hypothetical protein GCM10023086_40460 [Streptomyces venetus]|uniref:Uncharacterized protein n=1 Tax=Streptomyces venetus TaxID=1701086 RepID=A0ABP8G4Q0_9ACTN